MGWSAERWGPLLDRWERLLTAEDPDGAGQAGGLRREGATPAAILHLEEQIGRSLPPSYRTFLEATDGAAANLSGWAADRPDGRDFEGFRPCRSVTSVAHTAAQTIMLWVVPDCWTGPSPFEQEGSLASHLLIDERDLDGYPRVGHLLHAIAVTGPAVHGNIYLDPLVVDAEGEWEAWRWDADGCSRHQSLGVLVEKGLDQMEIWATAAPAPAPQGLWAEAQDLARRIEAGGGDAGAAVAAMEAAALNGEPSERMVWVLTLGASPSPAAGAAVVRLLEANPEDPVIVCNLGQTRGAWTRSTDAMPALRAILRGPQGDSLASSIVHFWPEPVEDEHASTGDERWVRHLLFARRPGSLALAVHSLGRPDLNPDERSWISYTLSHSAPHHPDPPQIEAVVRLADVQGNNRFHLAQALIGWSAEAEALAMIERALAEGDNAPGSLGTVEYTLAALAGGRLDAAAPVLARALAREASAALVRTLAFLDHPVTVPALVGALQGSASADSLLALEQVAAGGGARSAAAARDVLAARGSTDSGALRALARVRDERALPPLLRLRNRDQRSATAGLADLCSPAAVEALIAASADPDDEVAVTAVHGLLRARAAGVQVDADTTLSTIAALVQRPDRAVRILASRWVEGLHQPPPS